MGAFILIVPVLRRKQAPIDVARWDHRELDDTVAWYSPLRATDTALQALTFRPSAIPAT